MRDVQRAAPPSGHHRHAVKMLLTTLVLALPLVAEGPYQCEPVPVGPAQELCDNGVDDDGDGMVDCEDVDCADDCGAVPACPTPVIGVAEGEEALVQSTLHLSAEGSYAAPGHTIAAYVWSVEQPAGSASVFTPSPSFPNPTFEANVLGTYRFHLEIIDDRGVQSCVPATYEVLVRSDGAVHIELLWHTPGDPDATDEGPFAGTDVDLHLMHPNAPVDANAPDLDGDGQPDPYFDSPYDCFWFNPAPDWGTFGDARDDPHLDRDDTDGAGPENINLDVPEPGAVYRIAVHDWNDHGYGPSFATVRVYVYNSLAYEASEVRLVNHDLWCVGFLHWPSGAVTPCTDEAGEPWITPNYQHPMFEVGGTGK